MKSDEKHVDVHQRNPVRRSFLRLMDTDENESPPHDGDGTGPVRQMTHVALRRVLDDRVRGERSDGEIADILHQICEAARRESLSAEKLIIMIKQSWRGLAVTQVLERHESEETLSDFITSCIKEYYRPVARH